jgi:hypothetical protein
VSGEKSPWGEPVAAAPAPAAGSAPRSYGNAAMGVPGPGPRPDLAEPFPARSDTGTLAAGWDDQDWQDSGPAALLRRPLGLSREPGRLFRATRAGVALVVISLGMGLALASAFGLLFWALASAIHHASS